MAETQSPPAPAAPASESGTPSGEASPASVAESPNPFDPAIEAVKDRDWPALAEWAGELVGSRVFWIDLGLIGLSSVLALVLYRLLRSDRFPLLRRAGGRIRARRRPPLFPIALLVTSWATLVAANANGFYCPLLRLFSLILTWYVFFRLPSVFLEWKSWMGTVSTLAFAVAVLHVLGLLDDTAEILEGYALELGEVTLSALDVFKGVATLLLLLWVSSLVSRLVSDRISRTPDLSPNVKELFSKGARIGLFILAFLIALAAMGVQPTTLTVFGGALGLGLGFGLQKVVSNLFSGLVLLMDKSIKPGDVVEIGETYGWINALNFRYVSVITRDNKEHLIPNEDLITNPVINWSYSSKLIRIRAPFGISYQSDLRLAIELAQRSARECERVVDHPAPRCNLLGFGDSSVNFELRFWIQDPQNGVGVMRSQVLLALWDAFHENGIAFPFPQRDVHLRFPDGGGARDLPDSFDNTEQSP